MNALDLVKALSIVGVVGAASALSACNVEAPDASNDVDDSEALGTESDAIHFHNPLVLQDTPQHQQKYVHDTKGWLKWAMALPWSTGPVLDTTGAACAQGQDGPVWYLAGTAEGDVVRDCTIPSDKKLFFPLRNTWSVPPAQFVDTPDEVANFVAFFTDYFPEDRAETCTLSLKLDGHDLLPDFASLDANLWVQILDPFKVFLNPIDNFEGDAGGHMPAALVDGHYALLKPLSPGDHTLEFSATQCTVEDGTYFETAATYHLHVQGPDHCNDDD